MARLFVIAISLMLFCSIANAEASLRVGSKVLTLGDSVVLVQKLMGEPDARVLSRAHIGDLPNNQLVAAEQWQYGMDGKTIIITIAGERVANIETLYE